MTTAAQIAYRLHHGQPTTLEEYIQQALSVPKDKYTEALSQCQTSFNNAVTRWNFLPVCPPLPWKDPL